MCTCSVSCLTSRCCNICVFVCACLCVIFLCKRRCPKLSYLWGVCSHVECVPFLLWMDADLNVRPLIPIGWLNCEHKRRRSGSTYARYQEKPLLAFTSVKNDSISLFFRFVTLDGAPADAASTKTSIKAEGCFSFSLTGQMMPHGFDTRRPATQLYPLNVSRLEFVKVSRSRM